MTTDTRRARSLTLEDIASVCHEANRALQAALNDPTIPVSPPWHEESEHQRDSILTGVRNALSGISPEESHAKWCAFKRRAGWVWGPTKNEKIKTHPLLVAYHLLRPEDQAKDALFISIVRALAPLLPDEDEAPPAIHRKGPLLDPERHDPI
jgi:hypothetical protein